MNQSASFNPLSTCTQINTLCSAKMRSKLPARPQEICSNIKCLKDNPVSFCKKKQQE